MSEITKELLEALKSIMALPDHKVDRRDEAKAAREAIAKAEAFLAAPQPADDGWIPWKGGECPVAHGTVVDVRLRLGHEGCDVASNWRWHHATQKSSDVKELDIIAYRVVKP